MRHPPLLTFQVLHKGMLSHTIVKTAGAALGTVGWVITDLKERGFLVDMGNRGRLLAIKEKLIER